MPVTVNHQLSATTPDDPLYEIKPSNWNDTHAVTFNAVGSEISGAFGNGGGVTFGLSADGKITAAAPAGGGGITNINVSAGSTSNNLSAFEFNNGNGVTFGLNGSTVTASVQTNYLTTAMASNAGSNFVQANAAFAGTNASGTIASNGISVSVGNYITTARASNDAVGLNTALTAGPLAWTVNSNGISLNASNAAGTTSGFGGNLISGSMTHNTAGLNLSLNHPAWLTTAMQSNAATISNIRVSAGTTSNLLSALTFSNSNGVSFGINGSTMTASHNGLTTARASNDGVGLATAQSNVTWSVNSAGISIDARGYAGTGFTGTNATATLNSNGLQLSVAGGGVINQTGPNISAGTDSLFTSGTVTFGNAFSGSFVTSNGSVVYSNAFLTTAAQSDHSHGNPTLALTNLSGTTASASNGFTLSLSAAAAGGGVTESIYYRPNDNITTIGAPIVNSASIVYCPIDHALSATRFDLIASINVATAANVSSAGFLYSATAVLYTLNGGTLSSVSSGVTNNQMTWTSNATGSVTGGFFLSVPLNVNAADDKYWVGVQLSTRATGLTGAATTSLANTVSLMGVGSAIIGAFSVREPGSSTANSNGWFKGMGMYSGTSNFSTIGLSNLTQQGTNAQRANVALRMVNL
jgi:hypothetical protein